MLNNHQIIATSNSTNKPITRHRPKTLNASQKHR